MAMICYRDLEGRCVVIHNPTQADTGKMWDIIVERNKEDFNKEIREALKESPLIPFLVKSPIDRNEA